MFTKKTILEIYWEAPAYCMYAQGAIVGTSFSFGYQVSSWNLQIVQVNDPNLDNLISSRGIMLSYVEWFWYQQSITISAQQSIQIPCAFSSVRGIVWGIRRTVDLTSNTLGTKQYLMSSELTSPVSLDLRINSQKRQQDVFTSTMEAIAETRRFLPISYYNDYWSNITNNNSTNQMLGMLAGGAYCTSCSSGLNSQTVNSQMYLEFTLTSNLTTPSLIDIFILHDRSITTRPSTGSLYIDE
jgi:hypothetical protein